MTLNANLTDQSNLVTLTSGPTRYTGGFSVSAPLPESFGVDIQSQMTQPFSSFIPTGLIQTGIALYNVSASAGIAIGKYYTGTETPDISFDMNFVAQYDALTEVVIPVAKLYVLAASYKVPLPKGAASFVSTAFDTVAALGTPVIRGVEHAAKALGAPITVGTGPPPKLSTAQIRDFLYWLGGPPPIRCYFGNIYELGIGNNPVVLSGMEPRFTNNIDYNGLPMQCTVSITLTLKQPYFTEAVAETYARGYKIGASRAKLGQKH